MKNVFFLLFLSLIFGVSAVRAQSEIFVSVSNNLSATPRENETVVLDWNELLRLNPALKPDFVKVSDSNGGAALAAQAIDADADGKPEKFIFQVNFAPNEKSKRIKIEATAERQTLAESKTFARFVPERMDDFAWENDRVAFRTYGKALEKEMISSGIDVWAKRVPELIIDKWYKGGDAFYHTDSGMGLDFYSVKRSRGCGGAGIWDGTKMHVSRNFVSSRVLANGPIRTVFELRYEPWNVNGVMVSETKRFTIDAGQNFYRVESFYDAPDDLRDIDVAVGIAKHEPDFKGEFDKGKTWMSLWETNEKNGSLGCAVIADAQNFQSFKDIPAEQFDFPQHLSVVAAKPDKVARYWVGAGWSRYGFADKKAWLETVNNFAQRAASPLVVSVVNEAKIKRKQALPLSQRLVYTLMNRIWLEDDGTPIGIPAKWNYEQGVQMKAVEQLWYATGDPKYYDFIKRGMDYWFDKDGKLSRYDLEEYNIDHVTPGRGLITLYRVSGDKKYKDAIDLIRSQLKTHPRTKEGGFWHKKIYPWQMWLDGLYMGQPFYAEYSVITGEDNWNDIANQFVWMEKNARDPKTGLLYHGWDESREQRWANKQTGLSPHVWGRAMGWYAIALVDVLDSFPKNHPRRAELVAILNREAEAIANYQDKRTGVWYDIIDLADRPKNYLESSASAMFVYAIAKGVRQGNLPEKYLDTVRRGWAGIKKEFIRELADGNLDWEGTVSVSGLGGNPYRDGSFDYYMSEKLRTNDAKGLGPAVMAAVEMEALEKLGRGKGKTVLLDSYFNNETKKDASGRDVSWHYKWDEMNHPGFALLGRQFEMQGARLDTLYAAPTAQNLNAADVYIIVDPDDAKENPNAKFISGADAKTIAEWVKKGGVLVLLGNDLGNAEFDNWNVLAKEFGIEFNKNSLNRVQGTQFEQGKIEISGANEVFRTARKLYLKEISTLKLSGKAKSLLEWNGETVMATVKHGKGTVFAVGDPWLYNEYTDGRKLPADFQNFQAAQDLTDWLLRKTLRK
jgi:unsaturated rhamnogalacturonyl hydrolase